MSVVRPSRLAFGSHLRMRSVGAMPFANVLIMRCEEQSDEPRRTHNGHANTVIRTQFSFRPFTRTSPSGIWV
jgi:hypothetical protein